VWPGSLCTGFAPNPFQPLSLEQKMFHLQSTSPPLKEKKICFQFFYKNLCILLLGQFGLCNTSTYIDLKYKVCSSDQPFSYFASFLWNRLTYLLQGYAKLKRSKFVALLNKLTFCISWILSQGSGREPDPGADRGGLRGEREREPREPDRNHRSSTTRALPGATSGRLREPMSTATPSPVGRFENL